MKIEKASPAALDTVRSIVRETINAVYPHYYPKGTVDFFLAYHSGPAVLEDIGHGYTYLFSEDGRAFATGSVKENEIYRLYVLPEFQGRGRGSRIMDFLEASVFDHYEEIWLDAAFPAQSFYLRRGYRESGFHTEAAEGGDFLCYYELRLKKASSGAPAPEAP